MEFGSLEFGSLEHVRLHQQPKQIAFEQLGINLQGGQKLCYVNMNKADSLSKTYVRPVLPLEGYKRSNNRNVPTPETRSLAASLPSD